MTLPRPKEFGAQELLALSEADEQVHYEMQQYGPSHPGHRNGSALARSSMSPCDVGDAAAAPCSFWVQDFPRNLLPHGTEAIPASCCPYLAGSSGGQAGGQASWLCSRLVMMAWRRSSTVALGSAGGQDTKGLVLGKSIPGAEPREAAWSCPPRTP